MFLPPLGCCVWLERSVHTQVDAHTLPPPRAFAEDIALPIVLRGDARWCRRGLPANPITGLLRSPDLDCGTFISDFGG